MQANRYQATSLTTSGDDEAALLGQVRGSGVGIGCLETPRASPWCQEVCRLLLWTPISDIFKIAGRCVSRQRQSLTGPCYYTCAWPDKPVHDERATSDVRFYSISLSSRFVWKTGRGSIAKLLMHINVVGVCGLNQVSRTCADLRSCDWRRHYFTFSITAELYGFCLHRMAISINCCSLCRCFSWMR